MKRFVWWVTALLALAVSANLHAQQVGIVSVTSNGFGKTEAQALTDAVINGVAQVNGEAIASSMRMTKSSTSSTSAETSSKRTIDEEISRRTQGIVKSWRKISVQASGAGDFTATASVSVAILRRSEQLKRMKLAVVSSKTGDPAYEASLAAEIVQNLTTSRKFAIMDRKNNDAIGEQLSRIRRGGGAIEDQVRLTAEVAPDYLAVVTAEVISDKGGRPSVIGKLEIIDYSTRQVKFSEKKSFPMKEGDEAASRRRLAMLGKGLSMAVIQTIYPPVIVGMDDGHLSIAQGSDFFGVGDKLIVWKMGSALRDPHTGEFLSNDHTDIGTAVVTFSDARITKAKVDGQIQLDPKMVVGKKYQVSHAGESMNDLFAAFGLSSRDSNSSGNGNARKPSASGDSDW